MRQPREIGERAIPKNRLNGLGISVVATKRRQPTMLPEAAAAILLLRCRLESGRAHDRAIAAAERPTSAAEAHCAAEASIKE